MPIRRSDREKPRSLSKQEKLVQWRDCTVVHPHLKQAFNSFFDAIYNPGGASLIFLFGPTGVGKTTLLRQIVKVMLEDHCAMINADSDYIPVAAVEARAPESGSFDWKGYYQSILVSLDGSTMPKWSSKRSPLKKVKRSNKGTISSSSHLATVRERVIVNIRHRRLIAFLTDEAQRFSRDVQQ